MSTRLFKRLVKPSFNRLLMGGPPSRMVLLTNSGCELAVLDIKAVWDALGSSGTLLMLRLLSPFAFARWQC